MICSTENCDLLLIDWVVAAHHTHHRILTLHHRPLRFARHHQVGLGYFRLSRSICCDTGAKMWRSSSVVVPMGPRGGAAPKYFEKMKKINYFGVKSILHRFCSRVIYPLPRQVHQGGIIFLTDYWVGSQASEGPSQMERHKNKASGKLIQKFFFMQYWSLCHSVTV